MSSLFERAKYDAFQGDYLTRLLYLNISVFLLFALTNAFTSLFTGNFGLIPNSPTIYLHFLRSVKTAPDLGPF